MTHLRVIGSSQVRWICACMIILSVVGSGAPAFAKHPTAKPSELWNQYPLNVQPGVSPSPAPSQSTEPSPKASQQSRSRGQSQKVKEVPRAASNGSGMFFVTAGVAMLLLGIAFSAMKQLRKPGAGGSVEPPSNGPQPSTSEGFDSTMNHSSSLGKEQGSVIQPDLAAQSEPVADKVRPDDDGATPPDVQQPKRNVEVSPTPTTEVSAPLRPDRERVRIELLDGRALEGWRRAPGKDDEHLVILDVIAAFDSEGNKAPTTRADGFILPTEIASIQKEDV